MTQLTQVVMAPLTQKVPNIPVFCIFIASVLFIIYSASVAGEETLHTYSYVQSHIKDTRWRMKT